MSAPWQLKEALARYRPGEWIRDALCAQIGLGVEWFPEKGESNKAAKRICGMCDVREECRNYALNSPTKLFGVWGGMSERERREIRRSA